MRLALALLLAGAPAFAAKGLEVVVKGTEQEEPSVVKPPVELSFDPYESVRASLSPDESKLTAASPLLSSWTSARPFILRSAHVVQPWADVDVQEGNSFSLSLGKEFAAWKGKPLDQQEQKFAWSLSIIDEDGKPFQRLSGQTITRKTIAWNGYSDSGRWLIPGHDYSAIYVFAAGTPDAHTGYGEPLRFPSLVYRENGRLVISLDSSALFGAKREQEQPVKPAGEALLRAAADLVRLRAYGWPMEVRVFAADAAAGGRQAKAARDFLSSELFLPAAKIGLKVESVAPSQTRLELALTGS